MLQKQSLRSCESHISGIAAVVSSRWAWPALRGPEGDNGDELYDHGLISNKRLTIVLQNSFE